MGDQGIQSGARVLTIGHSTRTIEEFAELLEANVVGCLIDVRTLPRSRRNSQFNADTLPGQLDGRGIGYLHLPALGGLRRPRPDSPNAGWRNLSFRGYADHMQTPEFRAAVGRLVELSRYERLCLMCAEAVWWRCHRRMISDALTVRDVPVEHILGETRRQPHTLTPWAKLADKGGQLVYPPETSASKQE